MLKALMQDVTTKSYKRTTQFKIVPSMHTTAGRQTILFILTAILLFGPMLVEYKQREAQAANPGPGRVCAWRRVHAGDTLGNIAYAYRANVWTIARANYIRNINLIHTGQRLCIPRYERSVTRWHRSGVLANGYVRWYAYDALEWSTHENTAYWIRRAAAYYGLPARLLMAIAWQESGWYQHVIAHDGGVGIMQIMPYTAMSINANSGFRRDPYKMIDNIYMGASFVRTLWYMFGGNIVRIISAYNEGGWGVMHYGIYNWRYVNNVLYHMRRLS
jgi:hypothetical protein